MKELDKIYQLLSQISDIPKEEWEQVKDRWVKRSWAKGDIIQRAGEPAEKIFLVTKGILRIYCNDSQGKEFVKNFAKENEVVCAYCELIQDIDSQVNIECLEEVETCAISYEDLKSAYDRHVCWHILSRKICEKYFIIKEQRVFSLLRSNATQRYEIFLKEYGEIAGRIPQYHIASYLGITPVSLSRLLSKNK